MFVARYSALFALVVIQVKQLEGASCSFASVGITAASKAVQKVSLDEDINVRNTYKVTLASDVCPPNTKHVGSHVKACERRGKSPTVRLMNLRRFSVTRSRGRRDYGASVHVNVFCRLGKVHRGHGGGSRGHGGGSRVHGGGGSYDFDNGKGDVSYSWWSQTNTYS